MENQAKNVSVACSENIGLLDDDCLSTIFSYLNICDRVKMELVSKRWNMAIADSWSKFQYLDFSHRTWGLPSKGVYYKNINLEMCKFTLRKCGKYIKCIDTQLIHGNDICCINFLKLVAQYCNQLKEFKLHSSYFNCIDYDYVHEFSIKDKYKHVVQSFIKNNFRITKLNLEFLTFFGFKELFPILNNKNLQILHLNGIKGDGFSHINKNLSVNTVFLDNLSQRVKADYLKIITYKESNLHSARIYSLNLVIYPRTKAIEVIREKCENLKEVSLLGYWESQGPEDLASDLLKEKEALSTLFLTYNVLLELKFG